MKTVFRAWTIACLLGAASLPMTAGKAFAQTPEERAGARSAARSGIEAYDAGRYAESLDLFTRAENLVHAPTHLLYIARSNLKLGHLVRAQEAYQQLTREKLATNAPQPFRDAQASAEQEMSSFAARIASVTVTVSGASDPTKVKVTLDDAPVATALIGIPFPIDPGAHRFAATAPGLASSPVEKTLADSDKQTVELRLQPAAAAAEPSASPSTPGTAAGPANNATTAGTSPTPAAQENKTSFRIPAYIALGVGVVGLGAGTYFLLGHNSANKDGTSLFQACDPNCTAAEKSRIDDFDSKAASRGTYSAVGFVVGGLAAAAGITLLILEPSHSAQQAALRVWVGPGSGGLSGRF